RRRHTRFSRDWSSDVCSSDLEVLKSALSDDEFLVYEALDKQNSLKVQDIIAILNKKTVLPVLQKLLAKEVIYLQEEVKENYKPRSEERRVGKECRSMWTKYNE